MRCTREYLHNNNKLFQSEKTKLEKKKKRSRFYFRLSAKLRQSSFLRLSDGPDPKLPLVSFPKEVLEIIYSWAHHLFHMQNYYTLLIGTV